MSDLGYAQFLGEPRRRQPASPQAWRRIEDSLGVDLPEDYTDFVDGYGDCFLTGHLYIPHPEGKRKLGDWMATERSALDVVFDYTPDGPEFVTREYRRLIPWAYHDWDGDSCYLLPPAEDRDWRVIILFRQCPEVAVFDGTFAEFIGAISSGRLMPRGWFRREPLWESFDGSPLA